MWFRNNTWRIFLRTSNLGTEHKKTPPASFCKSTRTAPQWCKEAHMSACYPTSIPLSGRPAQPWELTMAQGCISHSEPRGLTGMCKVHHLHQPTWPCLHDLVVVLCIFYLNINQFVQKSKENLFLFEDNRKDWLKITSLMFAYGSQIIEGKDRAQIYIERGKKKNHLQVFYLCPQAHIHSVVVHCKWKSHRWFWRTPSTSGEGNPYPCSRIPWGCLPQFEQMQGQISSLAVQLCVKKALIIQAANGKKLKHLYNLGV